MVTWDCDHWWPVQSTKVFFFPTFFLPTRSLHAVSLRGYANLSSKPYCPLLFFPQWSAKSLNYLIRLYTDDCARESTSSFPNESKSTKSYSFHSCSRAICILDLFNKRIRILSSVTVCVCVKIASSSKLYKHLGYHSKHFGMVTERGLTPLSDQRNKRTVIFWKGF